MSIETFKKALFGLLIISLGFLAVDRSLSLGLETLVTQSDFRLSVAYRGGHQTEILALGNSRAVNAFYAPALRKKLDKKVFHLGYNGMSMVVAEVVLSDYLAHNSPPKMLLLEVSNLGVKNELLKGLSPYLGRSDRLQSLLDQQMPFLAKVLQVSHLYRFNNELFLRAGYYLNRNDQEWINQGTLTQAQVDKLPKRVETAGDNPYPTSGAGFLALTSIQKQCREKDIRLVLIASPYLPAHLARWPSHGEWLQKLQTRLGPESVVHDYTHSLDEVSDFADAIHINKRGSLKLLDKMIADGVFSAEEKP